MASNHTEPKAERYDAFAYYSDNSRRMKKLLLKETDEGKEDTDESNNEDRGSESTAQQSERKTRLSWEVHPSLLIDDLLWPEEEGEAELTEMLEALDDILISLSLTEERTQATKS